MFFTPDVCAAGRPGHPVILHRFRLLKSASNTCGACADALAGGMAGKNTARMLRLFNTDVCTGSSPKSPGSYN